MTVTLEERGDFTLASFRRVAWQGEPVVVGPAAVLGPELAKLGSVERTTPQGCDTLGGAAADR